MADLKASKKLMLEVIKTVSDRMKAAFSSINQICDQQLESSSSVLDPNEAQKQAAGLIKYVLENKKNLSSEYPLFAQIQIFNILIARWDQMEAEDKLPYFKNLENLKKEKKYKKLKKIADKKIQSINLQNEGEIKSIQIAESSQAESRLQSESKAQQIEIDQTEECNEQKVEIQKIENKEMEQKNKLSEENKCGTKQRIYNSQPVNFETVQINEVQNPIINNNLNKLRSDSLKDKEQTSQTEKNIIPNINMNLQDQLSENKSSTQKVINSIETVKKFDKFNQSIQQNAEIPNKNKQDKNEIEEKLVIDEVLPEEQPEPQPSRAHNSQISTVLPHNVGEQTNERNTFTVYSRISEMMMTQTTQMTNNYGETDINTLIRRRVASSSEPNNTYRQQIDGDFSNYEKRAQIILRNQAQVNLGNQIKQDQIEFSQSNPQVMYEEKKDLIAKEEKIDKAEKCFSEQEPETSDKNIKDAMQDL